MDSRAVWRMATRWRDTSGTMRGQNGTMGPNGRDQPSRHGRRNKDVATAQENGGNYKPPSPTPTPTNNAIRPTTQRTAQYQHPGALAQRRRDRHNTEQRNRHQQTYVCLLGGGWGVCVCFGSAQGCGTQCSLRLEAGRATPDEGGGLGAEAKLQNGAGLGVMCRDTRLYIDDYRCFGGFGSMVCCWGGFCPGPPRVFGLACR